MSAARHRRGKSSPRGRKDRSRDQDGREDSGRTAPAPRRGSSEWLTGIHVIREALRARRRKLERLALRRGRPRPDLREIAGLAERAGIPIVEVSAEELEQRGEKDSNSQGAALLAGPLPEYSLADLLRQIDREGDGVDQRGVRLVALDGVEDPQNVGAIARVADSAGAAGLILTDRRAPPLSPALARASAGAIEWLPVARVSNLARALSGLQKEDFWLVATDPDAPSTLYETEDRILTGNLVVVLGAEGKGLRPSILQLADHRVGIPMLGRVASLNVSTAGAVVLYDLLRRSRP